ncbi:dual specificity phosphatase [Aphelenchoides avenae]|nr:dual specificity phosphatase [Aphelenchus avenae]
MAETSSSHENNSRKRKAETTHNNTTNNGGFNRRKYPPRWLDFVPVGRDIPGTRLIAFKAPLKPEYFIGLPDDDPTRFEATTLLSYARRAGKTMGLVVDLTNTDRYCDTSPWAANGVQYVKISCAGHQAHNQGTEFAKFKDVLNNFFSENASNDKIVGVHCTHGVNRTGYMICRYLITERGWTAQRALAEFAYNRRHGIERQPYIDALHALERSLNAPAAPLAAAHSSSVTSTSSTNSVRVPQEAPRTSVTTQDTQAQAELLQRLRALKPTPIEAKPLPELEQQIVCPYNGNHVVSALQIHYHMAQCRDLFYDEFRSSMQLVRQALVALRSNHSNFSCKYDGRHHVPAPEIELHEVFCHGRGTYRKVTNAISKPPVNVYSPHTATG